MNLPSVVPVMLLQRCNVFPHEFLPLNIFEQRYRTMLSHALEHDRMICVGKLDPAEDDDDEAMESDDRINEFSTVAIVRACVANDDGTSHLMLQGVQRVRFVSWEQYEPFRIARIEAVETRISDAKTARKKSRQLRDRVLELIPEDTQPSRQLVEQIGKLDEPEHLADFIAANCIRNACVRHPLLGLANVEDRIDFLLELLPPASLQKKQN